MEKKFYEPQMPKTYEEAVEVIKNVQKDEWHHDIRKAIGLRWGLVTGVGLVAAAILGLQYNDFELSAITAGAATIMSNFFLVPLLGVRLNEGKVNINIRNKSISEKEVIRIAKDYVSKYRKYISEKEMKK